VLRYLIALLILAALAAGGWWAWKTFLAKPEETAGGPQGGFAVPVEAVAVRQGDLLRTVEAVGTLVADEEVVIRPEIPGIITAISFAEGQRISAGAVLISLDAQILQAELDQARASLELSHANYERAEELASRGSGTQRARDEARAELLNDQAALALAEARLAKTIIVAPFEGVLGLRSVSVGDYVTVGEALVALSAIDNLKADFRIPELFLAEVKVGQELRITADALAGEVFEGEVYAIDPQLDVSGRALLIRARLSNPGDVLRPGLFARIDVVLERRANALLVPESAIVPTKQGSTVFRIKEGVVEIAPVETGLRRRGEVEILSGLAVGDLVVTGGQLKLRPGAPVQVVGQAQPGAAGGEGAQPEGGGTEGGAGQPEGGTEGGGQGSGQGSGGSSGG